MNSEVFPAANPDILQEVSGVKDEFPKISPRASSDKDSESKSKQKNSTSSEKGLVKNGLISGIFYTCLKPLCGVLWRKEKTKKDPWIIAFNELTEIRLVGSGAQGAVFLGHYKNQEVAIKKVKNEKDTEIKHLRHLDHRNIVKFRSSN